MTLENLISVKNDEEKCSIGTIYHLLECLPSVVRSRPRPEYAVGRHNTYNTINRTNHQANFSKQ